MQVTASNLASAINQLPSDREYNYINPSNKGKIVVHDVVLPEGPIRFKRYDASKGKVLSQSVVESISTKMLWRLANTIREDMPVNVDVVFKASYNSRSVLESLIAHSPQFYHCMPGRLQFINNRKEVVEGHKHIVFMPNEPHDNGVLRKTDINYDISEISNEVIYRDMTVGSSVDGENITIEQKREHARIQIALVLIGKQLGFRTWVAQNDRGIEYNGNRIDQVDSVIAQLGDEQVMSAYPKAVEAAKLIDCIWFRNGKLMPAVMEIEHSTGVTSGLTRMKGFYDTGPSLRDVRWTIVAPDADRERVMRKAQAPQFKDLDSKFFPYSAVMELYSICERRKLKGVTDEFLDCFMEDSIAA